MSFNIGLKLWSTNTDYYFEEAKRLYKDGVFDYIELYVVPDTLQNINKWKTLNIPFTLHAPHFKHQVNLADPLQFKYNSSIFDEVIAFKNELNAKYIVVHGGTEGSIDETIRQLQFITKDNPSHFLIENKPHRAPLGHKKLCRGASIDEIKKVLKNVNCGFCLDIGHAFCTANALGIEPYLYLESFNALKPSCYHLSDNDISSCVDEHMHLGSGSIDLKTVFSIITNDVDIAIETEKSSKYDLEDFHGDIQKIKKIYTY